MADTLVSRLDHYQIRTLINITISEIDIQHTISLWRDHLRMARLQEDRRTFSTSKRLQDDETAARAPESHSTATADGIDDAPELDNASAAPEVNRCASLRTCFRLESRCTPGRARKFSTVLRRQKLSMIATLLNNSRIRFLMKSPPENRQSGPSGLWRSCLLQH